MENFENEMTKPDDFMDGILKAFSRIGFVCHRNGENRIDMIPYKLVSSGEKTQTAKIMVQQAENAHTRG